MGSFGTSIVAAAFAIQGIAIGFSISLFPVMMGPIEEEFGASRTLMSFGIPSLLVAASLVGPWVGRAIDRYPLRPLMIGGVLAMATGLALIPTASSLAVAATYWLLLVGVGHGMCGPLPAMTVLANWFARRRATMISLAGTGTTAASAVVPPIAEALIHRGDWRSALSTFAVACALLGVPIVFFGIVKRPEDRGLLPDGASDSSNGASDSPDGVSIQPESGAEVASGEDIGGVSAGILRRRGFWFLAAGNTVMMGMAISVATHIVPLALERGLSREEAVALLSLNAVTNAVGKLAFGFLTDRAGALYAVLVGVALQVAGWAGILFAPTPAALFLAAPLTALGGSCIMPTQAGFVGTLFGRSHFGRASGLLGPFSMIGVLALPPAIGAGYDLTGSYTLPMTIGLAVACAPALLYPFVLPAPRSAGQPA